MTILIAGWLGWELGKVVQPVAVGSAGWWLQLGLFAAIAVIGGVEWWRWTRK